jgi:hypothetical protein
MIKSSERLGVMGQDPTHRPPQRPSPIPMIEFSAPTRELVLMEEPAEAIASVNVERCAAVERGASPRERWALRQRSMRAVPVVMLDVAPQHALEMTTVEDQQPVQALASHAPHPALGEGVRAGRPNRCSDDLDALVAEDLIEAATY